MTRTLLIGAALFVVFAVVFAPASLVRRFVPEDSGVELLTPTGTLWNGAADLYIGGQPAGGLQWDFQAVTILQGMLGYDVYLAGPDHDLNGHVAVGVGAATARLDGRTAAAFVNRWLGSYDIRIDGALTVTGVNLRLPYDAPATGQAGGSVAWAGGPVRYRLGGRSHAGALPPLVAYLGAGLEAVVYAEGGQTPLLRAEILPTGFARVGITQLFTELAGNPWPGAHPDHEVVLEVEEQLF